MTKPWAMPPPASSPASGEGQLAAQASPHAVHIGPRAGDGVPSPASATPAHRRHAWSDPFREFYATRRTCWNCGLMKVTRHEPGILPWVEYWRDDARVRMDENGRKTPPCIPAEAG